MSSARLPHRPSKRGIVQDLEHGGRQRVHITGRHQLSGLVFHDDLGQPPYPADDDGNPAGLGLDGGNAKTLARINRRVDGDIEGLMPMVRIRISAGTSELHLVGDPEVYSQSFKLVAA